MTAEDIAYGALGISGISVLFTWIGYLHNKEVAMKSDKKYFYELRGSVIQEANLLLSMFETEKFNIKRIIDLFSIYNAKDEYGLEYIKNLTGAKLAMSEDEGKANNIIKSLRGRKYSKKDDYMDPLNFLRDDLIKMKNHLIETKSYRNPIHTEAEKYARSKAPLVVKNRGSYREKDE